MTDEDMEDLKWEHEADQEWDEFYRSYGLNRAEIVRQMMEPVRRTYWRQFRAWLWGVYYRLFPPEYWR